MAWAHGFLPYTDSGELSVKAAINEATGATLALLSAAGSFWLAAYALAMSAVAIFMSWRVDVNLFSYNRFYGNRLARARPGAARERNLADTRQAHPLANFDPDDDVILASMATHHDGKPVAVQRPLQALRPSAATRISKRDYLFGSANYLAHNDEAAFIGTLLFVKPVLLADLPTDVFEYKQRGSGFPQETTGDQWFSEAQFESYRHLDEIITGRLCRDPKFTALL